MVNAVEMLSGILTLAVGALMLVQELKLYTLPFVIPNIAFGGIVIGLGILTMYAATTL